MGRNEKKSERASVTLSVTCESHGRSQFTSRLEAYYLFCVPLHGFLTKRETVRGRIEERQSARVVVLLQSLISLWKEKKRKEKKKRKFLQHRVLFQVGTPPN